MHVTGFIGDWAVGSVQRALAQRAFWRVALALNQDNDGYHPKNNQDQPTDQHRQESMFSLLTGTAYGSCCVRFSISCAVARFAVLAIVHGQSFHSSTSVLYHDPLRY